MILNTRNISYRKSGLCEIWWKRNRDSTDNENRSESISKVKIGAYLGVLLFIYDSII